MVIVKRLLGKTSLITGAGRGIGRATAVLFAREGSDLILAARSAEQLAETAALCHEADENCAVLTVPTDLSDLSQLNRLSVSVAGFTDGVDVLVNNAAVFEAGLVQEFSIDKFRELLEVNLLAPFRLSQMVMSLMDKKESGTIVNISSLSGCFGTTKFAGFGPYNISKYGLWGLTEILALENWRRGIRVNQLSLSGVDTQMFTKAAPPGLKPELAPEQVAQEILYLASEESAPITGKNLILDGNCRRWQSDD
jgi:NAD(P)-dependent dehydrogenase (short-subunit alcohol dehydrogenase family)